LAVFDGPNMTGHAEQAIPHAERQAGVAIPDPERQAGGVAPGAREDSDSAAIDPAAQANGSLSATSGPTEHSRLERALALALRYVGRRERTERQVREHLERRGCDAEAVAAALAELREQGAVDDARYARLFGEDRRRLDGWGDGRIARALRAAGVGQEEIDQALGAARATQDELAAASELLERRMPARLVTDQDRARALGLLVRRGHDLELAHEAIRRHRSASP
jgi:regulatory protein